MIEYLLIVLGVATFGIQHSGVSALRVKGWIIDRWGKEGYSNIFKATSITTILIAFIMIGYWDWLYFIFTPELVNWLLFLPGIILVIIGLFLSNAASKVISVSTVADMRTDRMPKLVTDGIYSKIRHPLYLSTILLLIALALLYPNPRIIVFSFSLSIYTMIGAYLEEEKLVKHYGQNYLEYRKNVGFILPKIRHSE